MGTLRTRLGLSATPALELDGLFALTGRSATGSVGTIEVTVPPLLRAGTLRTVLSLIGTPWWSYNVPTMLGVRGTGHAGFVDVIFDSAVELSSIGRATGVGFFNLEIDGSTTFSGIEATGSAGTVTVEDTVLSDSTNLVGIATTGTVGTLDSSGDANVTLTGAQSTYAIGTIFTGSAFTVSAAESVGTAGILGTSGAGAVTLVGVESSQGFAGRFDFTSRLVVKAIRITAYIGVT
jgi:hypothetical protein